MAPRCQRGRWGAGGDGVWAAGIPRCMPGRLGAGALESPSLSRGSPDTLCLLAADHHEQSAFPTAAEEHPGLDQEMVDGGAPGMRLEQLLCLRERLRGHRLRDAVDEFDARPVEPLQHLVDGVLRFVRVLVLILEPGLLP